MSVPAHPKVYHITHVRNLRAIVEAGRLYSDAKRIAKGFETTIVGMSEIKRRRLEELPVACHPGTMVGEYVPFYFCPRSIMLYILYRGNHPDLSYREGQGPIVHLEADLRRIVRLADECEVRWAFSDTNAGARYASFYDSLDHLDKVNWKAVEATDFRNPAVKDAKQAEFLAHESFPWFLVEKIGAANGIVLEEVQSVLATAEHQPPANVEPSWYF
ncbi:MAG TPA: DUF4433 domain-containing protein [Planctomycetaceae bacterium]|nr:DUF4433 domain-containing protein [Planctomycetaceae bacterium]